MGKVSGFLEIPREIVPYRDTDVRLGDFEEIFTSPVEDQLRGQAARCMDCGVPFCQSHSGCPIDNRIPEWNDLVYRGRWREALDRLHSTNNFPEFTGRTCPAPCEGACVLGITDPAVTIKNIENAIIDRGFAEGWVKPTPPEQRTGQTIAVVGSGPAGLAAAAQLNHVGHSVVVYEREDRSGGLLTYGIPNMKLSKQVVERRLDLLRSEGITFHTGVDVGRDVSAPELLADCDALLLATGATKPRDLAIPGRELGGIHFAMPYLTANTKRLLDPQTTHDGYIDAAGRRVIVIGGGDTGTDCIGTALRQGCSSLVNFELLPQPPAERAENNPWPEWPSVFRCEYGHEEAAHRFGGDPRQFSLLTKCFVDDGKGRVAGVQTVEVEWTLDPAGRWQMSERPDSLKVYDADLVLLALGFLGPEQYLAQQLGITVDERDNYRAEHGRFATSIPGVFAAGDCRRGQSLVVWAINEGRGAARAIDTFLMG